MFEDLAKVIERQKDLETRIVIGQVAVITTLTNGVKAVVIYDESRNTHVCKLAKSISVVNNGETVQAVMYNNQYYITAILF
jgi:DUF2075 family protein